MVMLGGFGWTAHHAVVTASQLGLQLALLGRMRATTVAGEEVTLVGARTRAILAVLALWPGQISRAQLSRMLWSSRDDEQRRKSLRQELFRLTEALKSVAPNALQVDRKFVAIARNAVDTDVFAVLSATIEDPMPLTLMKEPLLEDLEGLDPVLDTWLAGERHRVTSHGRAILEALLSRQTDAAAIATIARQLTALDPGHEIAWRALIRAHVDNGNAGTALEAYEQCKTALQQHFGARPSQDTEALVRSIKVNGRPQPHLIGMAGAEIHGNIAEIRVGVASLRMVGSAADSQQLTYGLSSDIAGALSRFSELHLVGPWHLGNTPSALHSRSRLDYLLEGSVTALDDSFRISFWLVSPKQGRQLAWSRTFMCSIDLTASISDEIVPQVVAQVEMEIQASESRRAMMLPSWKASARDLVSHAIPLSFRFDQHDFTQAGALFKRALELDPDFAPAHLRLASHLIFCIAQGWPENEDNAIRQARIHAQRAVALSPNCGRAYAVAGLLRCYLDHKPQEAAPLLDRAILLNPNLATAWGMAALVHVCLGDFDQAEVFFARYRHLLPDDPESMLFNVCPMMIALGRRDYVAAVEHGRRAVELNPRFAPGLRYYLVALGHAGHARDATLVLQRLLEIEPGLTVPEAIRRGPFANADDLEQFAAGLRLAGLPP